MTVLLSLYVYNSKIGGVMPDSAPNNKIMFSCEPDLQRKVSLFYGILKYVTR
jgi:hypothetical protein